MTKPYETWQDVVNAPRSEFFKGHTQDTVFDRSKESALSPSAEALFTQSNARVLVGHAANGMLRMVAMPTQVYPAPTQTGEFGLGPGMYHHFDVVMYAGNLNYQVKLDDGSVFDLGADNRENETTYADYFLPLTSTSMREGNLEIAAVSFAPVAPEASSTALSPAPLPGPAGVFYILILKNTGETCYSGRLTLVADDLLVGHYEDALPEMRTFNKPAVNLRQQTLILSNPQGAVGIHLHNGRWRDLEPPFHAECDFTISPGEEQVFEAHIALGVSYNDIMPVIYGAHMRSALDWLNLTASYWLNRLGDLTVEVAGSDTGAFSSDLYIRSLFDNFNCLQTDADGNLIAHWQGAPSHGYGTVWGIDVEPTAVSVVNLCPELARQVMIFFLTRSRVPKGPPDHSVPILVAPVIIARQWLQVTGDTGFLYKNPHILIELKGIVDDLLTLKAPQETLFPTQYSSDGAVGRRYDYGTNAKVHYACESMAYILEQLDHHKEAESYRHLAVEIREAISRHMVAEGPFGLQLTGGSNLGEDPGNFYLPEGIIYYDGEDTSSMLAPLYGVCDQSDTAWGNYHRFARSLWCPNYDVEFDVLLWYPAEPAIFDGTAFFSRLGGSVSRQEMLESFQILREIAVDEVTGSVFWWPHGLENKRALTRCSQGQGAWAWQYLEQWLGLKTDAVTKILTLCPRGLLTKIHWDGFKAGMFHFDIFWEEDATQTTARITNKNDTPWTVKVGFRPYGTGAEGPLRWQTSQVLPGDEIELTQEAFISQAGIEITQTGMLSLDVEAFGENGYLFKRFGPVQLWGHWDAGKLWDMQAMPLALRFAILNDTGEDWSNVRVTLKCPDGWTAQGRRPLHWDPADHLLPGEVILVLGDLPSGVKTVAPFWVLEPESVKVNMVWWNAGIAPFHQASQPGAGITLYTSDPDGEGKVTFTAELLAEIPHQHNIQKILEIPVHIVPAPLS